MSQVDPGIHPIVIGTAGHVDHGKSSLVNTLTGTNPDRLSEEQDRGLTIDIGFANFALPDGRRVGVIDVPGHERFVKNMVTGATGVKYIMLVVAADDGVMPQTREHLEILQLMGINQGCVVITKTDLVEQDLIELVIEDVKDSLVDSFLEDAEFFPVSSKTGEGIEKLKNHLCQAVLEVELFDPNKAFRMPVQRVFSAKGHGAVLTGIPLSGAVEIGDSVETLHSRQEGKVRGIQAYHAAREVSVAGHSSALNIAGVDHSRVERGHIVATPGYLKSTKRFLATVKGVSRLAKPIKSRSECKVHLNNAEHLATIVFLSTDKPELKAGETAIAQIELAEDALPVIGDRFILRQPSPAMTIGGGRVLDIGGAKIRRKDTREIELAQRRAKALDSASEFVALATLARSFAGADQKELAIESWLKRERTEEVIARLVEEQVVLEVLPGRYLHKEAWDELCQNLLVTLEGFHKKDPAFPGMRPAELAQRLSIAPKILNEAVLYLKKEAKVEDLGDVIVHKKYVASLPENLAPAKAQLNSELSKELFKFPELSVISQLLSISAAEASRLCEYMARRGEIEIVGGTFVVSSDAITKAKELSTAFLAENGEMKAAEFKNLLETSRKYAIPLLEHLDAKGFFTNVGGVRRMKVK